MLEKDLLSALGPLGPLYLDKKIRDIMVDSPGCVQVEGDVGGNDYRLYDVDVQFDSPQLLSDMIGNVLKWAGADISQGSVFDVSLTDRARMLAIFPPTAPQGPCLVIRKMILPTLTWEMLYEFGSLTPEMKALFQSAIDSRENILIAGGTSSGKTTIANLVAELIPQEKRLMVVEQVRQYQIQHPRAVYLQSGDSKDITWQGLMDTAAKMRPDWLVIGELTGPEALRAMEIINRGYSGLTTIHAVSIEDALARLESMCLMANLGLGLSEIRVLIASALQLICYQEYLPVGKRKIVNMAELRGIENDRYVLQPLIRYNRQSGQFDMTGARPSWEVLK